MKRRVNGINSVLASAFVLILIRPSVIFDAGFLLSYSAVIYIISFYQDFYHKLQFKILARRQNMAVNSRHNCCTGRNSSSDNNAFQQVPAIFYPDKSYNSTTLLTAYCNQVACSTAVSLSNSFHSFLQIYLII